MQTKEHVSFIFKGDIACDISYLERSGKYMGQRVTAKTLIAR